MTRWSLKRTPNQPGQKPFAWFRVEGVPYKDGGAAVSFDRYGNIIKVGIAGKYITERVTPEIRQLLMDTFAAGDAYLALMGSLEGFPEIEVDL